MNKDQNKKKQGYQDKISKETFAALIEDHIDEATDKEALEIWKTIVKNDPMNALKAIMSKSEKLE